MNMVWRGSLDKKTVPSLCNQVDQTRRYDFFRNPNFRFFLGYDFFFLPTLLLPYDFIFL
jgi:hypothetical protein